MIRFENGEVTVYVDIRDYYWKDGVMTPSPKNGIRIHPYEWAILRANIRHIQKSSRTWRELNYQSEQKRKLLPIETAKNKAKPVKL